MVRNPRRVAAIGGMAVSAVLMMAAPAAAHVTVTTIGSATQGGYTVLDFKVPSESDTASTVKLDVILDTPLPSIDPQPLAGWRVSTKRVKLATPITTDDGTITDGVGEIMWTAKGHGASAGVPPENFQQFFVSGGPLPNQDTMTFRAIQTYSNGDVVKWIETQAPGAAEPEHPAPVLQLASASGTSTGTPAPGKAAKSSSSDGLGRGIAIAALVVALIAAGLSARGLTRRS